ncbi:MAG: polyprenol monophosphomannose synthase [Candidatus Sumerlaeota bacterium]|nr:polyprenol monophosphomannose synthase [Candidatus Sumerlaeota bacterium]
MLSPILVIIPTYNEAENIGSLIPEILKATDRSDLAVLVVDDNSSDGTNAIVQRIAIGRDDNRVRLLSRPGKQGLGTAYMAGFRYALDQGFALAITMDADFSHSPDRLPAIITAAQDADIVVGSRYIPGGRISNWPLRRKMLSFGANLMAHAILRARSRDCTSGYRAYRREILEKIPFEQIKSDGYSFLIEMLMRCERAGASVAESPIHFVDRREGRSKISRKEIFKAFATLWRMFWMKAVK